MFAGFHHHYHHHHIWICCPVHQRMPSQLAIIGATLVTLFMGAKRSPILGSQTHETHYFDALHVKHVGTHMWGHKPISSLVSCKVEPQA